MFDPNTIVSMLILGLAAGVLGGLFGIGGGLVIVPALVILKSIDQKTATGTSLFALMWPVGILGVIEYHRRGEMRFDLGTWIAAGLVLGILVGAKLTAPLSPATMKRAYGVFLVLVGVYYLVGFQPRPKPASAAAPAASDADAMNP
jgi:uncharacterized membrane protein YfcA